MTIRGRDANSIVVHCLHDHYDMRDRIFRSEWRRINSDSFAAPDRSYLDKNHHRQNKFLIQLE